MMAVPGRNVRLHRPIDERCSRPPDRSGGLSVFCRRDLRCRAVRAARPVMIVPERNRYMTGGEDISSCSRAVAHRAARAGTTYRFNNVSAGALPAIFRWHRPQCGGMAAAGVLPVPGVTIFLLVRGECERIFISSFCGMPWRCNREQKTRSYICGAYSCSGCERLLSAC